MAKNLEFDPYAYVVHTERVVLDGDTYFRATVSELPNVEIYEETYTDAYDALIQCIVDLQQAALTESRSFPDPEPPRDADYSGRVTLRMGLNLHRRLDLQAQRNGNTLNAEIVSQLTESSAVGEFSYELLGRIKQDVYDLFKPLSSATQVSIQVGDSPYMGLGVGVTHTPYFPATGNFQIAESRSIQPSIKASGQIVKVKPSTITRGRIHG